MDGTIELETSILRNVPIDCRVNILSYLSPTCLYANYAYCSRWCHADSLSSELPQTKWGEFHVSSENTDHGGERGSSGRRDLSMESLLHRILHPSFRNAWQARRCHMKICGHEQEGSIVVARSDEMSFEELQELASRVSFEDITSLDMSVTSEIDEENPHGADSLNRVLPRCLPWLLSAVLPGLVELDFSNLHGGPVNEGDYISELSLFNASHCPNIRKISWHNRVGGCYFLRGRDLKSLGNLSELYMDNILCDWKFDKQFAPLINQFFEEDSIIQRFFFFACNDSLERVSLKGGRYLTMSREQREFPQWALMRFVRRTPTLKWFRSDLTEESIEMLLEERPEITLCN